jgi:hypothetical protein
LGYRLVVSLSVTGDEGDPDRSEKSARRKIAIGVVNWPRMQSDNEQRVAAVALVVAGACFLLYPAIRPFADEDSLAGAKAFASGDLPRWSGLPLVVGFALYMPQYLASQPVRIAHAAFITAGCFWIASALWRANRRAVPL